MIVAIVGYMVLWCLSLAWALRCVHTTRDDHEHILDLIHGLANSADRLRYLRNLNADATFVPHFWRVATFRDPWVVHHKLIQHLVRIAA